MNEPNALDPVEAALRQNLAQWANAETELCLAFSGGLDSSVLLHALASSGAGHSLRAIHVNHGLHPDAGQWADFCRRSCAKLGVSFAVLEVCIDPSLPGGPEARARDARYAALKSILRPGELLLTAHHQRDQAETFLLQLMRGAGPAGLAAMGSLHQRLGINVMRPLLTVSAADILSYAQARAIQWLEDPSNAQLSYDRNFLRHEILPRLKQRWPAADHVIARSARLCAAAAEAVAGQAADDLDHMLADNRLDLLAFADLSRQHQGEVLRAAIIRLGLPTPSEQQLGLAMSGLLDARPDAELQFTWPGAGLRRYRNWAWLYDEQQNARFNSVAPQVLPWNPDEVTDLGPVAGILAGTVSASGGLAPEYFSAGVEIRFRQGGERLRLFRGGPQRTLKNLLQENDVVPWMRSHIPLIYSGEQLLAVGDLWVNADCRVAPGEPGKAVLWRSYAAFR